MIKFNTQYAVLTLLCVLFTLLAYGQVDRLAGLVADQKGDPLPWAHVIISKKGKVVFTDEKGFFALPCSMNDSVTFSAVGFQTISILAADFNEQVRLKEAVYMLRPVEVMSSPENPEVVELGFHQMGGFPAFSGYTRVALFVANPRGEEGLIKEVHFRLHHRGSGKTRIRVRIYQRDSLTGLPGKDLLRENVFIDVPTHQSVTTADLSRYTVPFLREGVYVGLETIGLVEGDKLRKDFESRLWVRYSTSASSHELTREWSLYKNKWTIPSRPITEPPRNAVFGLSVVF